jgi:hypothetical protein
MSNINDLTNEKLEEWLDTPQTEDETITNRYIIDVIHNMIEEYYKKNQLMMEDKSKFAQELIKYVKDHTRS